MKHQHSILQGGLTSLLVLLSLSRVWAGSDETTTSNSISFWGIFLIALSFVALVASILYAQIQQYFKVRGTAATLQNLAVINSNFDWALIKSRVTDIFVRTHRAWSHEDMEEISSFSSTWYWQNQQMVFIDRWHNRGLVNRSEVQRINNITPLFVRHSGLPQAESSILVVGINANQEDYLMKRETGELVEGKKGFHNMDTLWTFRLHNGEWLLDNIEHVEFWPTYVRIPNEVPDSAIQTDSMR